MTTSPTLNGQVIGMTHYATRALLQRFLDTVAMTFEQSVVLGLVAAGPIDRAEVVRRTTQGLKVSADVALETLEQLAHAGLVSLGATITPTDAGRQQQQLIRAQIDSISAALYGDVPAEDLAVAGRVLTAVTERANSILAR